MIADPHQIQRLRFTPGQDLLARDFRDGETFEARLRHWHNRAMHQVYGVSLGLRARPSETNTEVLVEPGVAYDAKGRELALAAARTIAIPPVDAPHLLVLGHGSELMWIAENRLRTCDSVPLARVRVNDNGAVTFDKFFIPPFARPMARPRIGYGSTTPGGTAWQAELVQGKTVPPLSRPILSLSVQIDSRAAGFTQPPCYFAWLQGRFLYPLRQVLFRESEDEDQTLDIPAHFCPSIEEKTLSGFRVRVLILGFIQNPEEDTRRIVLARAQQNLSVCWMGIQMDHDTTSLPEVHNGNS